MCNVGRLFLEAKSDIANSNYNLYDKKYND